MVMIVGAPAQGADYRDEVREWVVYPCLRAKVALEGIDQESIDLGITPGQIVAVMVAEREQAIKDLAKGIKADTTWKARHTGYAALLRMCLKGLPAMK